MKATSGDAQATEHFNVSNVCAINGKTPEEEFHTIESPSSQLRDFTVLYMKLHIIVMWVWVEWNEAINAIQSNYMTDNSILLNE